MNRIENKSLNPGHSRKAGDSQSHSCREQLRFIPTASGAKYTANKGSRIIMSQGQLPISTILSQALQPEGHIRPFKLRGNVEVPCTVPVRLSSCGCISGPRLTTEVLVSSSSQRTQHAGPARKCQVAIGIYLSLSLYIYICISVTYLYI